MEDYKRSEEYHASSQHHDENLKRQSKRETRISSQKSSKQIFSQIFSTTVKHNRLFEEISQNRSRRMVKRKNAGLTEGDKKKQRDTDTTKQNERVLTLLERMEQEVEKNDEEADSDYEMTRSIGTGSNRISTTNTTNSNGSESSSSSSSEDEEQKEQSKKRKNYFPKKKKNKKVTKKESDDEDEDEEEEEDEKDDQKRAEILHCRCSPKILFKTIQNLTPEQILDVERMGFGNLLHLKVKEIPTRFAYWLLSKFNPVSSTLQWSNKKKIHISEEDIWITLGMPKGKQPIVRKSKREESALTDAWKTRLGRRNGKITTKQIMQAIANEPNGGLWFRRHLIALLMACVFEATGEGYVEPKILDNFGNAADVRGFNWCELMMTLLIEHRQKWEINGRKSYTGPILILVALYVDRVVLFQRTVERSFPTIKGWTFKKIKARQVEELAVGQFGEGYVDKRYNPTEELIQAQMNCRFDSRQNREEEKQKNKGEDGASSSGIDKPIAEYVVKMMKAAQTVAENMSDLMTIIKEAPDYMQQKPSIIQTIDVSHQILGIKEPDNSIVKLNEAIIEKPIADRLDDDELWQDQEWVDAAIKIFESVEERQKMKEDFNTPSFSLGIGLTQDSEKENQESRRQGENDKNQPQQESEEEQSDEQEKENESDKDQRDDEQTGDNEDGESENEQADDEQETESNEDAILENEKEEESKKEKTEKEQSQRQTKRQKKSEKENKSEKEEEEETEDDGSATSIATTRKKPEKDNQQKQPNKKSEKALVECKPKRNAEQEREETTKKKKGKSSSRQKETFNVNEAQTKLQDLIDEIEEKSHDLSEAVLSILRDLENEEENEDHAESTPKDDAVNIEKDDEDNERENENQENNSDDAMEDDSKKRNMQLSCAIAAVPLQRVSMVRTRQMRLREESEQKKATRQQKGKRKLTESEDEANQEKNRKQQKSTRTDEERKASSDLLSPYRIRITDITEKLDKEEKEVYNWLVFNNSDNQNMNEILFYDDRVMLRRSEILTMRPDSYIDSAVIDAWTSILSSKEKLKSKESPGRFFFSTDACMYTVVNSPAAWGEERAQQKFFEKLDTEVQDCRWIDIKNCDLIFFPIYHMEHFYIMSFNLKKNQIDLIDNSSSMNDEDLTVKYQEVPYKLVRFFTNYIKEKKLKGNVVLLRSTQVQRLQMPWRNTLNKVDCAIYVLRHMETYMGERLQGWNPGFKKSKNKKQMRFLRAKYCRELILADTNIHKEKNRKEARKHFAAEQKKMGTIDVEKMITSYVAPKPNN